MITVITIEHANRSSLSDALGKVQAELSQGFIASSGTLPATHPQTVSQPASCYPPGFPAQLGEAVHCSCKEPEELEPTSYKYEIEE